MNSETYGGDLLRATVIGLIIGLLILSYMSAESHIKTDTDADQQLWILQSKLDSCERQLNELQVER
jgi:uncharacterized membrane-anchored protein YhcB (DUF1043 family)